MTTKEWAMWCDTLAGKEFKASEVIREFRATVDRVGTHYDAESVGEFVESLTVLQAIADATTAAKDAATVALERLLIHDELMGGTAKAGVEDDHRETGEDPEIKRQWYMLTIHESGHAMYSASSPYWKPLVMAGLEVTDGGWFGEPSCKGYVDNALRYDNRDRNLTRDEEDDFAALGLAGSTAQAFWMNYVENTPYREALRHCYENGGSYDYWKAFAVVWRSKRRLRNAQEVAEGLVAYKWANITRMAEEARERRELTARQMKAYRDDKWGAR